LKKHKTVKKTFIKLIARSTVKHCAGDWHRTAWSK